MNLKNIVWLASYPKSGNTWTRAFLNNYIVDADKPIPINEMHRFAFGDSNTVFYQKLRGRDLKGLSEMEILEMRNRVLLGIAKNGADMNFVKTHNVNGTAFGHRLVPPELTRFAVYIARNPLDVVLSYSRHFDMDYDKTIYTIAHEANTTLTDENTVKQFLGPWSKHVESWIGTKSFPVHVMRYEDMKSDPEKSFAELVKKLGLPVDAARLDRAIEFSSFKELKRQEDTYGFIEQSAHGSAFFHSGKTNQWKTELSPAQIAQVRKDHGKVMRKFGYF